MFSLSFAQADFDLADNPPAVVSTLVPHVLRMDLCGLFGESSVEREPDAIDLIDLLHPRRVGSGNGSVRPQTLRHPGPISIHATRLRWVDHSSAYFRSFPPDLAGAHPPAMSV
jgi:hypothetical protein